MSDKSQKLELTEIKPGMTFEEVERNLVAALQRSGIRVDGYDPDGTLPQQAESRDLMEKPIPSGSNHIAPEPRSRSLGCVKTHSAKRDSRS